MIMTPQLKRAVRLAFRRTRDTGLGDPLFYKAMVARRLAACTEEGMIAVVRTGRDCDGCSYHSVEHMPAPTLMAWLNWDNQRTEWLDGPESCWIASPSEEPSEVWEELTSQWER